MIKSLRISALLARHLIPTFRDPIRITDMLYYPLVDIILFGFLALWAHGGAATSDSFVFSFLTCLTCWYLVYRSALEISRNLLIEIWDHHLINLLAGPLSILELMISFMIIGLIQATITFVYSSALVWFIFSKNLFAAYPLIFPFMPSFIVVGWAIGLLTAGLIFYYGKSVEFVVWAIPWFFAMLSGAYYSLNLFPSWMQTIAALFPGSYLFDGVRHVLATGTFSYHIVLGTLTALLYFGISLLFVIWMFTKSKENGLNNLD